MKKIILLSVLSIVVVMQSIIAQNNYRDFEFTIDTTGYYFFSSDNYLNGSVDIEYARPELDLDSIEPGIVDILHKDKYYPGFAYLGWDGGYAPALPYEEKIFILPYQQIVDSCVVTLHDVYTWKENIVLSTNQEIAWMASLSSKSSDADDYPTFLHFWPQKLYADGIYPLPDYKYMLYNDALRALPCSVVDFTPFIYDTFQKTLKIASSVTVRLYYKAGTLSNFQMDHLMELWDMYDGKEHVVNLEDLDEYLRQADAPVDEISSGMTISQSGRECTFQFAQPFSENINLYLYKTDGTLYRTILVEQGVTSLAVTLDDPGMYLYRIQNRKGKIIIAD